MVYFVACSVAQPRGAAVRAFKNPHTEVDGLFKTIQSIFGIFGLLFDLRSFSSGSKLRADLESLLTHILSFVCVVCRRDRQQAARGLFGH